MKLCIASSFIREGFIRNIGNVFINKNLRRNEMPMKKNNRLRQTKQIDCQYVIDSIDYLQKSKLTFQKP